MTKKTIRKIFIILIIYLPVQYILVAVSGHLYESEPWPALIFPGFKSVYVYNDYYVLNQTYFEITDQEGVTEQFRSGQFFPDMPTSKINGFMRNVFPDQEHVNDFRDDTFHWLYERAEYVSERSVRKLEVVRVREFSTAIDDSLRIDSIAVDQRITIPEGS